MGPRHSHFGGLKRGTQDSNLELPVLETGSLPIEIVPQATNPSPANLIRRPGSVRWSSGHMFVYTEEQHGHAVSHRDSFALLDSFVGPKS
jgi:hypothetical protein